MLRFTAIVKAIYLQPTRNGATMDHGDRLRQRSSLRLVEPELTLVLRGNGPDPRLAELARLLARRAAREVYEAQTKERRTPRS